MRTLIVTFDSNDDYNQQKQIMKIAESCENGDLLIVDNYDMLDHCMEEISKYPDRYQNMIILHENNLRYDDFEKSVKIEYHKLFENIEVLPEQFTRLNEADVLPPVVPSTQSQSSPGQEGTPQQRIDWIIFPWNAPIMGTAQLIEKYSPSVKLNGITYCPLNHKELWCSKMGYISQRFEGGKKFEDITVTKFNDLVGAVKTNGTLYYPDYLGRTTPLLKEVQNFNNMMRSKGIQLQLKSLRQCPGLAGVSEVNNVTSISSKAYQLGLKIGAKLKEKKLKYSDKDKEKFAHWLGNEGDKEVKNPRYAKRRFLIECIGMIVSLSDLGGGIIDDDKWRQFRDRRHEQLGFGEVSKTLQGNLTRGGAGLLIDAIKIGTDWARTKLDDKKEMNMEQLIVAQPEWEQFASLFDEETCYKTLPEDPDNSVTVGGSYKETQDEAEKNTMGAKIKK